MSNYYTYIAYSKTNNLREIGVTNHLKRRFKLLNLRYDETEEICKLVYYEIFDDSKEARNRENELNELHTTIIDKLVEDTNPMLVDLLIKR